MKKTNAKGQLLPLKTRLGGKDTIKWQRRWERITRRIEDREQ